MSGGSFYKLMTPHLLVLFQRSKNLNEFPVVLRVLLSSTVRQQATTTTTTTTTTNTTPLPPPPPVRLDVSMMVGALEAGVGGPGSDGDVVPCKCTSQATKPRRGQQQQQQQQRLFRGRLLVPGQWRDEWNKRSVDDALVHDFLNFTARPLGRRTVRGEVAGCRQFGGRRRLRQPRRSDGAGQYIPRAVPDREGQRCNLPSFIQEKNATAPCDWYRPNVGGRPNRAQLCRSHAIAVRQIENPLPGRDPVVYARFSPRSKCQ
jgi:hypothetical protein